jgi:hypothetical protein
MRRSLLSLLLVLATPAAVGAETTLYFMDHAVEVASPWMLLVLGLALITLGTSIRRWWRRVRALGPEPELPDGLPPLSPPLPSHARVGSPASDAEETVLTSTDPSA